MLLPLSPQRWDQRKRHIPGGRFKKTVYVTMTPKDVQRLIPGTCDDVTLQVKRPCRSDSVKDLGMEVIQGDPKCNHKFIRVRQREI